MNALEFAINMELDGEKYYNGQAKANENNALKTVFFMMAKEENTHAKILQSKADDKEFELKESGTLEKARNLFHELGEFEMDIKQNPDQLDVFRAALEKEKESIELYEKMLSEAEDEQSKKVFDYLIKQEADHYAIIEEMVIHLNGPQDWVESAEFGNREEY